MKVTLSSLKEKIKKMAKMCESTDFKQNDAYEILSDGLIDIIDIKTLNNKIQFNVEDSKNECNKEQTKAEQKNLYYQNYIYQKENIINQINQCDSYQTPQIKNIYPSQIEDITIDKLNEELLHRKRLHDKYNDLSLQKETNLNVFSEKQNYIKALPSYLNKINTNSIQAQNLLNAGFINKYENEKLSKNLPQPLYVLFYSLLSNQDRDVTIMGKESELETFYNDYPNEKNFALSKIDSKEEGEQSDEGEITVKNNYATNDTNNTQNSHIKKFPLHLEFKVNDSIRILFYYIPVLNIVTSEVVCKDAMKISTNELMSNIFDYKPNYIITNKTSNQRENINQIIQRQCDSFSKNEIFYEYIQILTNNSLYTINNIISPNEYTVIYEKGNQTHTKGINDITISNFINEVNQRLSVLPSLKKELNYIKTNKKIPNSNKTYKTSIINVDSISYESYYKNVNNDYNSIVYFDIDENGNLCKKTKKEKKQKYAYNEAEYIKIELKNDNFTIIATVEIGYDYPKTLPQYKIKIHPLIKQNSKAISSVPPSLKGLINNSQIEEENVYEISESAMEEALNEPSIDNMSNKFIVQIEKLLTLCDNIQVIKN